MSQLKVNTIRHTGASSDAVTLATDGTCTAKITNNLSNRNKIINGAMRVAQRATSRTGTGGADGYWITDRWRIFASGAARFTVSQPDTGSGQPGFPNSYKFDCTTADTSVAAGEYLGFQQILEGQDVQDFLKGTSSAKEFTLSFYVKTNKSGVYTVELNDHDNTRQISKTFTVSDGNWNRYTVTFPADTTGFFDNDNDNSLQVNFWLIAGTNYTSGTLNSSAWAAKTNANRVSSSNVNIGDSTSNDWEITGVQLEVGSVATDFEHRSYGDELRRCQRYYWKWVTENAYGVLGVGWAAGTTRVDTVVSYPVTMRGAPSFTTGGNWSFAPGSGSGNTFTPTLERSTSSTAYLRSSNTSGLTAGVAGEYRANNDTSAYIALSAEL